MAALKTQLPPNADLGLVQGNIGLQWGMREFRYGSGKAVLAKTISQLRADDLRRAAKKYLQAPTRSVITIRGPSVQTTTRSADTSDKTGL